MGLGTASNPFKCETLVDFVATLTCLEWRESSELLHMNHLEQVSELSKLVWACLAHIPHVCDEHCQCCNLCGNRLQNDILLLLTCLAAVLLK